MRTGEAVEEHMGPFSGKTVKESQVKRSRIEIRKMARLRHLMQGPVEGHFVGSGLHFE
jgi:hypothetical protein